MSKPRASHRVGPGEFCRRALRWLLVVGGLAACACVAERPPCSAGALANLEAHYTLEVLDACDGYETPEACPAYPAIREKYAKQREEWVQCR